MMDRLDRMLHDLPREEEPAGLTESIVLLIRRRHRRGQAVRGAGAALLGALGVWLLWPGILWVLSNELFVSSAPWLTGGLDYLNYETLEALSRVWNGAISMQGAIGSTLAASLVVGAALLCTAIFLA